MKWNSHQLSQEILKHKTDDSIIKLLDEDFDPFRADQLGSVLSIWWNEPDWPENAMDYFSEIATLSQFPHWFARRRINRGHKSHDNEVLRSEDCPEVWISYENQVAYELRRNSGLSYGLFLDQVEQRKKVQQISAGLNVLNLFSYTGGFSVCAALGNASQVTTVDLSKNYIEWCKRNFDINSIPKDAHKFWVADSFKFLIGGAKRSEEYNLIICDPPSFSRDDSRIFKVERDYAELLEYCANVLAPKGFLYFSTNYEGWSERQFEKNISTWSKVSGLRLLEFVREPNISANKSSRLKGSWLQRR